MNVLPRVQSLHVVRVDVNIWDEFVQDAPGGVHDSVGHLRRHSHRESDTPIKDQPTLNKHTYVSLLYFRMRIDGNRFDYLSKDTLFLGSSWFFPVLWAARVSWSGGRDRWSAPHLLLQEPCRASPPTNNLHLSHAFICIAFNESALWSPGNRSQTEAAKDNGLALKRVLFGHGDTPLFPDCLHQSQTSSSEERQWSSEDPPEGQNMLLFQYQRSQRSPGTAFYQRR